MGMGWLELDTFGLWIIPASFFKKPKAPVQNLSWISFSPRWAYASVCGRGRQIEVEVFTFPYLLF